MTTNTAIVELGPVENSCFVVMPFHELFRAEFERVIRPAIVEAGLECRRGDEIFGHQPVVHDIWRSIRRARLVVAELSGRNANVLYEVGLAHAIGKPIILVTRTEDDVPFDLKALRYLFYDTNNPFWGQSLRADLFKAVRAVVDSEEWAPSLPGIEIPNAPPAPPAPVQQPPVEPVPDVSGVWFTSWLSVQKERRHTAKLIIPREHGPTFLATMTVEYVREEQRTIVEESLTGSVRERRVLLTGIGYTFLEQGSSRGYGLDSFDLALSPDHSAMRGQVTLKHGVRDVVFTRGPQ